MHIVQKKPAQVENGRLISTDDSLIRFLKWVFFCLTSRFRNVYLSQVVRVMSFSFLMSPRGVGVLSAFYIVLTHAQRHTFVTSEDIVLTHIISCEADLNQKAFNKSLTLWGPAFCPQVRQRTVKWQEPYKYKFH